MTTRTAALAYLPTIGLLTAVQGIRFYVRNPKG